jgi:hypothetical protein
MQAKKQKLLPPPPPLLGIMQTDATLLLEDTVLAYLQTEKVVETLRAKWTQMTCEDALAKMVDLSGHTRVFWLDEVRRMRRQRQRISALTAVPDAPDEDGVKELLDQAGNFLLEIQRRSSRVVTALQRERGITSTEVDSVEFSQIYFIRPEGREFYLAQYVRQKRFLDDHGHFVYY